MPRKQVLRPNLKDATEIVRRYDRQEVELMNEIMNDPSAKEMTEEEWLILCERRIGPINKAESLLK